MKKHHTSPLSIGSTFFKNKSLILSLAKREVVGRYKGSLFGMAWSFFNPLLMLGIYTFFFSFVLKARWGAGNEYSHSSFAIILFAGLIVHGLFSECILRSTYLISGNVNFVKKVIFPIEILPWVVLISAIFHMLISICVMLMMMLFVGMDLNFTIMYAPIVLLPLFMLTIGVSWILASIGVYVSDIGQIMSVVSTILLFLSPIFFPLSSLPAEYRNIAIVNPLTLIVEQFRDVMIFGISPDWHSLSWYYIISLLVAFFGFFIFQKLRNGFADVL